VAQVRRVSANTGEIASASKEQGDGIQDVNQAVTSIDQITQQNAALVEEATAAEILKSSQRALCKPWRCSRWPRSGRAAPRSRQTAAKGVAVGGTGGAGANGRTVH
jgi:methyl-accepting chemotaxis protein